MDGRGNVFVEILWRSIKYEEAYLPPDDSATGPRPASVGISSSTTRAGRSRCWTSAGPTSFTSLRRPSLQKPPEPSHSFNPLENHVENPCDYLNYRGHLCWNHRQSRSLNGAERVDALLKGIEGNRLTYGSPR